MMRTAIDSSWLCFISAISESVILTVMIFFCIDTASHSSRCKDLDLVSMSSQYDTTIFAYCFCIYIRQVLSTHDMSQIEMYFESHLMDHVHLPNRKF